MNDQQPNSNKLIDTTDCLEAVDEFRWWKNVFFIFLFLSLIISQMSFWLVDSGIVKKEEICPATETQKAAAPSVQAIESTAAGETSDAKTQEKGKAEAQSRQIAVEPNEPKKTGKADTRRKMAFTFRIKLKHINRLVRMVDFVIILTATLYCLTMLFALKVSLLGRLGGINHIARAFFLSLVFLVIILPWQQLFGRLTPGVIYTPTELLQHFSDAKTAGVIFRVFYYLRFTAYWVIALIILVIAQYRSCRWTKAVLKRLEII